MKNTDILNYLKCNYTLTAHAILLLISGSSSLAPSIHSLFKYSLDYNIQQPNKDKLVINFQIGIRVPEEKQSNVCVMNV
jgi:hypothetical protein